MMKKTFKKILLGLILKLPRHWLKDIFPALIQRIQTGGNTFISVKERPKQLEYSGRHDRNHHAFAIILQGPIMSTDDYTFHSVVLYLSAYPGAQLIVSTWEGETYKDLEQLNSDRLTILRNTYPQERGPNNINLQIISTVAGIQKAKELGCQYVLKSRTDQRFYAKDVDIYFKQLQKLFPLDDQIKRILSERLMVLNFTTLKYRPYGIGDMFMFGRTTDMFHYWDLPLNHATLPDPEKRFSVMEHAKLRLGEVYILTEFLKKINHPVVWTLEATWEVYTRIFCIVDHSDVDLHWNKYDSWVEDRFEYYENNTFQIATFKDWVLSYNGLNVLECASEETILNSEFGGNIKSG